jgi:hypothetical protein
MALHYSLCVPSLVQVVRAERAMWAPGALSPSYLTVRCWGCALASCPCAGSSTIDTLLPHELQGDLAGDYGFDPMGLGANPERLT